VVEVIARTHTAAVRPWVGRTARRVAGTALIGLGVRVALVPD
jgi:threonine/homoserine/homoserine lactone efflux protein